MGFKWEEWTDDKLLELKISELGLTIENSPLTKSIQKIHSDLGEHGLLFRPHFWLSDEFFSPDGIPGVAIPFYLAHPRLRRLEQAMMKEVEGGDEDWLQKILRHEVGHAIEHAYKIARKKDRVKYFGKSSQAYPKSYLPKPYSKSYVIHLDNWYAQSHPDEDFAETFAVWLRGEQWQERYKGWPALRKLKYIDKLMKELKGAKPPVITKKKEDPLHKLNKSLAQHYLEKRARFGIDFEAFYDRDLKRLFSDDEKYSKNLKASQFIRRNRVELRKKISYWTAQYQYNIAKVLEGMMSRCDELNLRLTLSEEQTKTEFTIMLTVQSIQYLYKGKNQVAL